MSEPKLFYVGIKGLIRNSKGEVLVLLADTTGYRENIQPYWDLPGGRIEEGDDEGATLRKEIREETGITDIEADQYLHTVISSHLIPIKDSDRMAGLVLRIWSVSVADGSEVTISDEHSEYQWVRPQLAAERLRDKYPAEFCRYIGALHD